jgi:hypothetical protein
MTGKEASRREIGEQWLAAFHEAVAPVVKAQDRCEAAKDEGEDALRSALHELVEACISIREWLRLHPSPSEMVNTEYEEFACRLQSSARRFLSKTWRWVDGRAYLKSGEQRKFQIVGLIHLLQGEDVYLKVQIDDLLLNIYPFGEC